MELNPQMEHETAQVDGRRVAYTARGPQNARYVYIGINGLMGGGDSFWPVIQGVPGDWRVVLPDLPGCGGSEPMPAPYKHNMEGYARWLGRFVSTLGMADKRLVIASVATGAPISIRYAFEHGDSVAGQVLHLPFFGKVGISAKWVRPLAAYALSVPLLRQLVDRLRARDDLMHMIILHEPPEAIPEMAERDIAHKQHADLTAAGQLLRDLMLSDARAELLTIRSPALILASEHDFAAPPLMLETLARFMPDCTLYIYRGGQHSWNEEFVEAMNREISRFAQHVLQRELSARPPVASVP